MHSFLCVCGAVVNSVNEFLPTVVVFCYEDEEFQAGTSVTRFHFICTPTGVCCTTVWRIRSNVFDPREVNDEPTVFTQPNLMPQPIERLANIHMCPQFRLIQGDISEPARHTRKDLVLCRVRSRIACGTYNFGDELVRERVDLAFSLSSVNGPTSLKVSKCPDLQLQLLWTDTSSGKDEDKQPRDKIPQ